MSLQVEKLEHNMAKLTIEVAAEELEKALDSAYQKQKKQISVPGFRKGKVPRAMIEKMYGVDVFYEDAANALMQQNYAAAVDESGIDIVSRPTVDVVQIEKGSFVVVLGHNGSGKSTLAKIIAGIYTPTSGRILLDGEDITGLDITQRAHRGVSFAFQQPVRFKGLTVKDLITLASGKNIGVPEACNYLSEVGLCAKDYIDREVDGSLSGGELKRIEIAMIMARGTKLSVFDEPEAGIDLWSFSNLIQVFEHLHEKINGSILIISHQERILNIADRIIVLADGQVRSDGGREEILPQLLGEAPSVCSALSDKVK